MWACYRVCGDEEAGLLALSILCLILLLSLFHHFLLHCSFFLFSLYYLPFLSSFHSSKLSFVLPIYRHLIHSLFPMLFFLFFSPLLSIVSALCVFLCVISTPILSTLWSGLMCSTNIFPFQPGSTVWPCITRLQHSSHSHLQSRPCKTQTTRELKTLTGVVFQFNWGFAFTNPPLSFQTFQSFGVGPQCPCLCCFATFRVLCQTAWVVQCYAVLPPPFLHRII